jgi:hypothetical protein
MCKGAHLLASLGEKDEPEVQCDETEVKCEGSFLKGLLIVSLCYLFRFAIFFPARTLLFLHPGSSLEVHFWHCCGPTRVNILSHHL